jgi:hypothetical protein
MGEGLAPENGKQRAGSGRVGQVIFAGKHKVE